MPFLPPNQQRQSTEGNNHEPGTKDSETRSLAPDPAAAAVSAEEFRVEFGDSCGAAPPPLDGDENSERLETGCCGTSWDMRSWRM